MFDFHEKRKIRSIVFSKVSIALLFFLTFFVGMSAYERYGVEREMERRLEVREGELETLKLRAVALEADVEHLRNERGIEEEIRSRFDVAKDGEQVVVILDDEDDEDATVVPVREKEEAKETEQTWWDMLKFW